MDLRQAVAEFLELFRRYMDLCLQRKRDLQGTGHLYAEENALRHQLLRRLGRIQPYLNRIGHVGWWFRIPGINGTHNVLDNALGQIGQQETGVLHLAEASLEKAAGALEDMSPEQMRALSGARPRIFLSYAFRQGNEGLVSDIKDVLGALEFDVVEGEVPRPDSVSAKVRGLIESSSGVVALLTNDAAEGAPPAASEWVRQEAVFGLGRNKTVVRIIEEGLDTEGRIFGDAEYVPLARGKASHAIARLVRMLGALRQA